MQITREMLDRCRSFVTYEGAEKAAREWLTPKIEKMPAAIMWVITQNTEGRFTPVVFLRHPDVMWLARPIAQHGWYVMN